MGADAGTDTETMSASRAEPTVPPAPVSPLLAAPAVMAETPAAQPAPVPAPPSPLPVAETPVVPLAPQFDAPVHETSVPVAAAEPQPVADPLAMFRDNSHTMPAPEPLTPPAAVAQPQPEASDFFADMSAPEAVSGPQAFPNPEVLPAGAAPAAYPDKLSDAVPDGDAFDAGMESLLRPEGPDRTSTGLVKRDRTQSQAPVDEGRPATPSERSPAEIRSMLARYREGLKGRPLVDLANEPTTAEQTPSDPFSPDNQHGGHA